MSTPTNQVKFVKFSEILVPEDQNVRSDLPRIRDLAESISARGLLQPLVVTNGGKGKHPYTLVAGFRRAAALASLGWAAEEVPVIVREYEAGDVVARFVDNIRENQDRADVSSLDLAERAHQLVTGTYPVNAGEVAVKVEKKVVAELCGWGMTHLNNLLRLHTSLDPDVQRQCRKHNAPIRLMLQWAVLEGKGKDEDTRAEATATLQMEAFEEWLKAKEEIEKEGRKYKKAKKVGASGSGDEGDSEAITFVKAKKKRAYLEACIHILAGKVKEESGDKALMMKGRVEALKFVLGESSRLPGVSERDFKLLEAAAEEAEEEEESTEE